MTDMFYDEKCLLMFYVDDAFWTVGPRHMGGPFCMPCFCLFISFVKYFYTGLLLEGLCFCTWLYCWALARVIP
ncbi:hypothetical protein BDV39DRAFT_147072 [Aspergillus sergii]|uniref:Uncharacterized protein n=1 Tax=Aspergillus sergii TaxID=1034303 RepID=A0A5N6WQG0_9EURO|nr:hypothetical protein BDV39DRAFT_147072 [Aspergillus sergii]